jgi:hypothetical protein
VTSVRSAAGHHRILGAVSTTKATAAARAGTARRRILINTTFTSLLL